MVSYPEWTAAVHEAYKEMGGGYGSSGVVEAITRAAAKWWNEYKDEIAALAFAAAVTLAKELIKEYIDSRGSFP